MRLTPYQKNLLKCLAFGGYLYHWWYETKEDVTLVSDGDVFDIRLDTFRRLRDENLITKMKSPHEDCDFYGLSRLGEKHVEKKHKSHNI